FHYNKVFAGSAAVVPLAIAVVVGLAIGMPLRLLRQDIFWNEVLALGIATWTAAFLAFRIVNLGVTQVEELDEKKSFAHSQKAIGPRSDITDEQVSNLMDDFDNLPESQKLVIKTTSPIADKVLQILTAAKLSPKAVEIKAAFPH